MSDLDKPVSTYYLFLHDEVEDGSDDAVKLKGFEVIQKSFMYLRDKEAQYELVPVNKETTAGKIVTLLAEKLQNHNRVVISDIMCCLVNDRYVFQELGDTSVINYVKQNSAQRPCGHFAAIDKEAMQYISPLWHPYLAARTATTVEALDFLLRIAEEAPDLTHKLHSYGNEDIPQGESPVYARWNGDSRSPIQQYKLYLNQFDVVRVGDYPTANTVEIGMNLFRRYSLLYASKQQALCALQKRNSQQHQEH